ncbi:hypothetical protein LTR70_005452 [Exophiala xenobiotica]|uniref:DNA ligase D 3'-phosphoesterase domain-containing protein n=1 Tax=Lithohypha guttulata TaxID=1690604 RepID=A0ABR0K9R9_9EURO|nr:hypothetical protein LTR24_005194 [Lithohypha guttulata]KAK5318429.1 hypothetical protein LTR70_005452 [Exophiala xenobiotica]
MVQKRPRLSTELSYDNISRKGLQSLARTVSPPLTVKKRRGDVCEEEKSATAAVEAGEKNVADQLTFWSTHSLAALRPQTPGVPRLNHREWIELYERNAGSLKGCHYVVHQHDHPIAGTHYDLRLQCNPTSSISFAIMYGLPGDPNSRRVNRNATETRVHCLWNHLIETASHSTGSMLIWDTGEFEVLPHSEEENGNSTAGDSEDEPEQGRAKPNEQERLRAAFQRRKIKLRLHGTKLPSGYTLALRLTRDNYRGEQPKKPSRRRRRQGPGIRKVQGSDGDSQESSTDDRRPPKRGLSSLSCLSSPPAFPHTKSDATDEDTQADAAAAAVASDGEDEAIRANNAYTGATNDIGSIHQRKWFLSVDRRKSGFIRRTAQSASGFVETIWTRRSAEGELADGVVGSATGFDRFVVGGRETEHSVVTGRLASEILADEGVVGFVPRGHWRAITE